MLAAMSAGYQRMLARDASFYAIRRIGVGGAVIRHELPRLALGKMLGGALLARALAYLALEQDANGVDLAGLRDLTKSVGAQAALESMIACEHVLGGRAFDGRSRVNAARANLHLFGVVEGEDDMIRMGMVRDVTNRFVSHTLRGCSACCAPPTWIDRAASSWEQDRLLRIGRNEKSIRRPARCAAAARERLVTARRVLAARRLGGAAMRCSLSCGCRRVSCRLSLLPRYRPLPKRLRRHARFAERKLEGCAGSTSA